VGPSPEGNLLAAVQRELVQLATELHSAEATLDLMFLAYLMKTSRFGYFTFGPVTLDVRLIEDLVRRTTTPTAKKGEKPRYSDDCLRFFQVLADEVEKTSTRRADEAHFLLAFMQMDEGIPQRVFSELGVAPDEVRSFVPESAGHRSQRLLSPEEAAAYLGVHVKTVRSWIRSGALPASRLAGQRVLRIREADLEKLLEPVRPEDTWPREVR
jgi:excisionase family DNA binding protein